jgi:hypothetical protein
VTRLRRIGRDPRRPPRRFLILTSGPIRAGKTTLAERLAPILHADLIRTKNILIAEYGAHPDVQRQRLQALGEQLDVETDGRWVSAATQRRMARLGPRTPIIVDSVRIPRQVEHLRELPGVRIVHVHLTATLNALESRYSATAGPGDPPYSEVRQDATERRVSEMRDLTWVRLDTTHDPPWSITIAAVTIVRVLESACWAWGLAVAFMLGSSAAAVLTIPIAWFWFAHLGQRSAFLISAATFAFFGILGGSALTSRSPIERDAPESAKESRARPSPERATPPAGPEVVRARSLTATRED